MNIRDVLRREHVIVPLRAETVPDALAELLEPLEHAGVLRDRAAVQRGLTDRRARDLVLIGDEVALPHVRTNAVDHIVVALGVSPRSLRRPEIDAESGPRIIALILAPPEEAALYLQTVSALARLLRQEGVIDDFLAATSPDDILGLAALARTQVLPRLTVRDLMVHTESVHPDLPVRDAVDLMIRKRIRALPVLNDKQEVLGIVSEWDVMRGLLPQIPRAGADHEANRSAAQLKVRDIMTRSVLCVSEDLGIEEAASMMINKDVEQFPVVSEGKLTGFLSRSDIIRKLFAR
jgi:CBS domain-containing protein